jgi:hypothetical protein
MSWDIKNTLIAARGNLPLNEEEIIQGSLNTRQDALRVEQVATSSATYATITSSSKTNQTPGTAQRLVSERGLSVAHQFQLVAYRPSRAENTGIIWLGVASGSGLQFVPLNPRQALLITAPPGKVLDLYDLWIDGSVSDDGVVWLGLV